MITIDPTSEDRAAGRLLGDSLRTAVDALRTDGLVLLEDVVDPAHLDVLHERILADIDDLRGRPDAPYNWNVGNLQQNPPPFPPYLFPDVLLNPYVISITSTVLGPGVKNVMYGGNTALPGDQRQPVHSDVGHLWPIETLEAPHPPAQLVVNVLTVDVSPENGATEIWPGTHRELGVGVGDDIKITPDRLEQRRAISPPFQPTFRRGSVLIRDIRLWHAGMPNRTNDSATHDRDGARQRLAGDRTVPALPDGHRVLLRPSRAPDGGALHRRPDRLPRRTGCVRVRARPLS